MAFYKTKSLVVEFEFAVAGQFYKTANGFASFPEGTPLQKHRIWNPDTFEVSALFEVWAQADFEEFFDAATDADVKAIRAQNAKDAQAKAKKDAEIALKAAEEATKVRINSKREQVANHPNQDPANPIDPTKLDEPALDKALFDLNHPDPVTGFPVVVVAPEPVPAVAAPVVAAQPAQPAPVVVP